MNRLASLVAALASIAGCTDPSAVPHRPTTGPAVSASIGSEVIDLGTLGGNSTTPRAVNDAGQVVGTSVAADGQPHPFVWEDGTMRELSLLPGTRPGFPFPEIGGDAQAISNTGLVAGLSYNRYDARMVLWDSAGIHDLQAPGSPISRSARAIRVTDDGDVLATVVLHDGSPPTSYPVLWQGGVTHRLPALRGWDRWYRATAMNNREQVIGAAASASGYQDDRYRHPVLWDNGAIQDLGVLRAGGDTPDCYDPIYHPDGFCSDGTATDINQRGDVVGYVTDTTHFVRAFLWSDGQIRDLGVLPGMNAYAIASNERGQVAGFGGGRVAAWEGGEGFLWRDGEVQLLGSLGGGGTVVTAMSQRGDIVGSSLTAAGERHAFVWSDGVMTDLGLGPEGGAASIAIAVNARGDVLGVSGTPLYPRSVYLSDTDPSRGLLWPRH